MRPAHLATLPLALISLALVPSAQGQTANVVYACYGNSIGDARIVAGPGTCGKNETFIQWNVQGPAGVAGPSGPTGPQGPAGTSLPHVILVPATTDPNQNGTNLLNAVTAISSPSGSLATASQPYVVQLDAGTYTVSQQVVLTPNITLQGAGMNSTFLQFSTAYQNYNAPVSIQTTAISGSPGTSGNVGLTNLTLVAGPTNSAFSARLSGQLLLDRVKISGSSTTYPSTFTDTGGGIFLITNSVIGYLTVGQNLPYHVTSAGMSQVIASEIDSAPAFPPPANVVCLASYNATNKALSSTCN